MPLSDLFRYIERGQSVAEEEKTPQTEDQENQAMEKQETEVQDRATEEDEDASTDVRYEVSSYGADYPVDGLVKRLGRGDIKLPTFQREFVWSRPQASRFIESLLLGLPVPAIFLSKEPASQELLVIDGQQRLKSLLHFYEGVFRGKEFSLQGVNTEFEGYTYKALADQDRRRLDDAIIHAIIVRQEDPKDDDSSIFLIFERLNTTSTPLSQQEIRACVYHGEFNEYLDEANKHPDWRAIYGPPSLRQKDKELLLRFFALYFDVEAYERPLKLFLSNFMRKNRHFKLYGEQHLNDVLVPTVSLAKAALGPARFRPQRALNASVTDALLVGTARRLANGALEDQDGYRRAVDEVLSDPAFAELYTVGTTTKDRITARIGLVAEALTQVS